VGFLISLGFIPVMVALCPMSQVGEYYFFIRKVIKHWSRLPREEIGGI